MTERAALATSTASRCRCAPTAAPRPSQSPHRQSTTITTVSCAAISVSGAGAACAQGWWPTLDLDQRNPSPQAGMLFSASFLRGVWRQPLGLPRYVVGYEFTQHPRENDQQGRTTMKLATIALASAFALSSTFALACPHHYKYRTNPAGYSMTRVRTTGTRSTIAATVSTRTSTTATRTIEADWLAAWTRAPTGPKSKRRVSAGLCYALFDRSSVYGAALKRN